MIILGIDPGLNHTGWGAIKHLDGKPIYLGSDVITTNSKLTLEQRLADIHTQLLQVIKIYKPKAVALEKVFVNTNASSSLILGHARGVILMTPALFGLAVAQYAPNTIKKMVAGQGHANKEQVQKMVTLLLNLQEKTFIKHDVADALAIALCHYFYLNL